MACSKGSLANPGMNAIIMLFAMFDPHLTVHYTVLFVVERSAIQVQAYTDAAAAAADDDVTTARTSITSPVHAIYHTYKLMELYQDLGEGVFIAVYSSQCDNRV